MDEPFGAVDPIVRGRLQDEFRRLQDELGKTVVLVTHDIDEAIRMGDRVAVFAAGGRLAQYATPGELLAHPADEQVADFVGAGGLRTLTVTRLQEEHLEPLDGVATGDLGSAIDIDSSLEDALGRDAARRQADGRGAPRPDVPRRAHARPGCTGRCGAPSCLCADGQGAAQLTAAIPVPGLGDVLRAPAHRGVEAVGAGR